MIGVCVRCAGHWGLGRRAAEPARWPSSTALRRLSCLLVTVSVFAFGSEILGQGLCSVCNRYLEEGEATVRAADQMTSQERVMCSRCAAIPELCFLCAIPAKDGRKSLSDGRHYCARDAQVALFGSLEVERVCREAVAQMERPFARYFTLPKFGVTWEVEDLTLRAQASETEPKRCAHPALRLSIAAGDSGKRQYTLTLINGLPPARIRSAAVHGIMHVWLAENVAPRRRMRPGTVESFCDMVAWLAMTAFEETSEAERVRGVHASDSQFVALVNAYELYDLYRVLEWMKYGADDRLVAGDDDGLRRLDPDLQPQPSEPRQVIPPSPAASRAPDSLVLRGILGTGARRLALINDATLAAGEEARAHVGAREIRLKCLEIRDEAVVVQVDGGARQELRLTAEGKDR